MSHEDIDIIRAWKDEEYRNSLSEEQRAQLPENPAGMVELADEEMEIMAGGGSKRCGNTGGPRGCNTNRSLCIKTVVVGGQCNGATNPIT